MGSSFHPGNFPEVKPKRPVGGVVKIPDCPYGCDEGVVQFANGSWGCLGCDRVVSSGDPVLDKRRADAAKGIITLGSM